MVGRLLRRRRHRHSYLPGRAYYDRDLGVQFVVLECACGARLLEEL